MKRVFPIIISKGDNFGFVVYVPDLDINTEGETLEDAIMMARDAIGAWGISAQDLGKEIPEVKTLTPERGEDEMVTLVDVDFDMYRKMQDNKMVRKNLTIPSWLNELAVKENINFSHTLQNALMEQLNSDLLRLTPSLHRNSHRRQRLQRQHTTRLHSNTNKYMMDALKK